MIDEREESIHDSQSNMPLNKPLVNNKTKFPSVGDATAEQRQQEGLLNHQDLENASNDVGAGIPIASANKHDGGHSEQLKKKRADGLAPTSLLGALKRPDEEERAGYLQNDPTAKPGHRPKEAAAMAKDTNSAEA